MLFKSSFKKIIILLLILFSPSICLAHFGTIMSQKTMLDQSHRKTKLIFAFLHPFEQNGMDLAKPSEVWAVNLTTMKKRKSFNKNKAHQNIGSQGLFKCISSQSSWGLLYLHGT